MGKKKVKDALGHRERQILDTVYQLKEASVGEVLAEIPDPPSYSTIRKMLSLLEEKGFLRHREDGNRYVYRPARSHRTAGRSAARHLLSTFFAGSAADAMNAILDVSASRLDDQEIARLQQLIDDARKESQSHG